MKQEGLNKLPKKTGVYLFKDKNQDILYIGKSVNIATRVRSYFNDNVTTGGQPKLTQMVKKIVNVDYKICKSDFDALILEAQLIKKFKPRYNSLLKDDKHYLYIKISSNEKFPAVTTARKEKQKNALYFGPYPSSRTVKDVLNMIRRIFPYCTQKETAKRRCFYSHINLCNPCPADIVKAKGKERVKLKKEYARNVNYIINLLEDKRPQVEAKLKQRMQRLSQQQCYEEAEQIKKQLTKLQYIVRHGKTAMQHYLQDSPAGSNELKNTLRPYFPQIDQIKRIEGYDISNTTGKQAAGSMVVFIYGQPEKKEYRLFNVRANAKPNDPLMLGEVLQRRISHVEWNYPDLILVDGGKPQVTAGIGALQSSKIDVPLVGLAKREERVIIKNGRGFKTINLPRDSKALLLLRYIRDEAHRFANKQHMKLRNKQGLNF